MPLIDWTFNWGQFYLSIKIISVHARSNVFSATQDTSGSVTKIKFCQKPVFQNLFLIEQLICGKICFQSDGLFIAKSTVLMTVIADQENK